MNRVLLLTQNKVHHRQTIGCWVSRTTDGSWHWASRVIDQHGRVWYNNGIVQGRGVLFEGHLASVTDLIQAKGTKAAAVFYWKTVERSI